MKGGTRIALVVLALALVAGFVSLGRWQWSRGEAKEVWLREYEAALAAPPRPIADALESLSAVIPANAGIERPDRRLPQRVEGRGRYVENATVYLDNQIRESRVGVMVYTRFQPNGTAKSVLVNRGFVPMRPDRSLPDIAEPPTDEIDIAGLLVRVPSAGLRMGETRHTAGGTPPLLAYLDVTALSEDLRAALVPAVIELDADAPHGFERKFEALPNTLPPERHRGYAVQWFGLAIAVAVITLVMLLRRPKKTDE